MNRVLPTLLLLCAACVTHACDAVYVSPIAISKHWGGSGWNEVHPGITGECRVGRVYLSAGRMRNSVERNMTFATFGVAVPIYKWVGARAGVITGTYDNTVNTPSFTSPLIALTLADGETVAFDVIHSPANGFSSVPVTLLAARWRIR